MYVIAPSKQNPKPTQVLSNQNLNILVLCGILTIIIMLLLQKKIQRRALWWIFNDYDSVTVLPQCYKDLIGLHYNTVIKGCVLHYCTNLLMDFWLLRYVPSYFTIIHTNTRIHHQSYYMNSFFPKTIREWNNLPHQIVDANSLDLFEKHLNTYLS